MKVGLIHIGISVAGTWFLLTATSCQKHCKNPKQVEFPEPFSTYVDPMRPGAWWKYLSSAGDADSMYVTSYQENRQASMEERDGECLYLPMRRFNLNSAFAGSDFLEVRYEAVRRGHASLSLRADVNGIIGALSVAYAEGEGFKHAVLKDTTIANTLYTDALVLSSNDNRPTALAFVVLVKNVGIVGYSIGSNHFNITNYFIP